MSDTNDTPPMLDPTVKNENELSFSLSNEFVAQVQEAIAAKDVITTRALVAPLSPPDQAELFEQLDHDERR